MGLAGDARRQAARAKRLAKTARRVAPKAVDYARRGVDRLREEHRTSLPTAAVEPTELRVSAIVPNYNHAEFLNQRLESILRQTTRPFEVIILDDASTDESLSVIEGFRAQHPDLIRVLTNSTNSGSVFRQWRKGVEAASGDVVWLCESDDFAEVDFLERLLPEFNDDAVQIATGRIQFADSQGREMKGLDGYRQRAIPDMWDRPFNAPAAWWFTGAFGVWNMIPNVGGAIFRRTDLAESVWDEAQTYSVLGDWFLYAHLARGGKIAFNPGAVSYFRQHDANTSVDIQRRDAYYDEHQRLAQTLRTLWDVPTGTVMRMFGQLNGQLDLKGVESDRRLIDMFSICLLYTSPSPRDATLSRMPSSA